MRTCVISGGGSKIIYGIGAAKALHNRYDYNQYVGISAGSIICLFAACNKLDDLHNAVLNARLKDIFNKCPVNSKGNLSWIAKLRILLGAKSFGECRRFKDYLKKFITPSDYEAGTREKEIKIGVTNFNLMQCEYKSSKDFDFDKMMDWCIASTSIPMAMEPVKMGDFYYFDGGVINYIGLDEAMKNSKIIDAIFHSPIRYKTSLQDYNWKPNSFLDIVKRSFEVMDTTIAADDIEIAEEKAKNLGISMKIYAPTSQLTDSFYKIDVDSFKKWYELGKAAIEQELSHE